MTPKPTDPGSNADDGNDVSYMTMQPPESPAVGSGVLQTARISDCVDPQMTFIAGSPKAAEGLIGESPLPAPAAPRYRPLRPHAKGGLGEVFVAHDCELGREVALKEIQSRFADHMESRRSFLQEAEITARLEHPGVVPVYGLGRYMDGRPYYAMRFIRGSTMHDAIHYYHTVDAKKSPADRNLAFRQLLLRFVTVCNTIAYAHSRGILHQDLKPANFMMGKYGEVLVVDWGLARPFERRDIEMKSGETALPPESLSSAGATAGGAVGTPAYMSPEQTFGRPEMVGAHSDVYCLGTSFYHLLTGKPPLSGEPVQQIIARVQRGDYPAIRSLKPEVPKALEAVCMKAMALDADHRYATPLDFAADIEHWLGDEPVTAFQEPWSARALRWVRRHRTFVTTAVSLLVVGFVLVSGGLAAVSREQVKTEAARAAEARRKEEARAALDEMTGKVVGEWMSRQATFSDSDKAFLENALKRYKRFAEETGDDESGRAGVARANWRAGTISARLGKREEAEAAYAEAMLLFNKLISDFPNQREYRIELARIDAQFLANKPQLDLPQLQRVIEQQSKLLQETPSDPELQRDLADSVTTLGFTLGQQQKYDEARIKFAQALELREKVAKAEPKNRDIRKQIGQTMMNLGNIANAKREWPEARRQYDNSIKNQEQLVKDYPKEADYGSDLALAWNNLGVFLSNLTREKDPFKDGTAPEREAKIAYRKSVDTWASLVQDFPGLPKYRLNLVQNQINFGIFLTNMIQLEEAEQMLKAAVVTAERLVDDYSKEGLYALEVVRVFNQLGTLDMTRDKYEAAITWYGKAVDAAMKIRKDHPSHAARANRSIMISYANRAEAKDQLGQIDAAMADWDAAIELDDGRGKNALRLGQAVTIARQGNVETAEKRVTECAKDPTLTGKGMVGAAIAISVASTKAPSDDERRRLESEAIRYLQIAATKRAIDGNRREWTKNRPDFKNLQARPEFQKIFEEPAAPN